MMFDADLRVALATAGEADEETRDTVAAWIQRARRLTAFVKDRCPPDLPPITVFVSPVERSGAEGVAEP